MNNIQLNNTISRCQSLAKNKEFICQDCKWAENISNNRAYCSKVGFSCNGDQTKPVQFCSDFDLLEGGYE